MKAHFRVLTADLDLVSYSEIRRSIPLDKYIKGDTLIPDISEYEPTSNLQRATLDLMVK